MRVISGKYKGRKLKGFDQETTRPTTDRIKESVFSMIQNEIKNSVVLDLFGGSGSLGIEALSNGAKMCYFVEKDKKMGAVLLQNIQKLQIDNFQLYQNDYLECLKKFKNKIKFDIVFLDPPYHLNLISIVLSKLKEYDMLNTGAIVVCEYDNELIDDNNYEVIKYKKYNNKNIKILTLR